VLKGHRTITALPDGKWKTSALEPADGTPFLAIGDTSYSLPSNRFKWYDDDQPRPIGPSAGFKDYVRYRKAQGFNWVNVIAAFPNWKTDDKPWRLLMPDGTTIRTTGSSKLRPTIF